MSDLSYAIIDCEGRPTSYIEEIMKTFVSKVPKEITITTTLISFSAYMVCKVKGRINDVL